MFWWWDPCTHLLFDILILAFFLIFVWVPIIIVEVRVCRNAERLLVKSGERVSFLFVSVTFYYIFVNCVSSVLYCVYFFFSASFALVLFNSLHVSSQLFCRYSPIRVFMFLLSWFRVCHFGYVNIVRIVLFYVLWVSVWILCCLNFPLLSIFCEQNNSPLFYLLQDPISIYQAANSAHKKWQLIYVSRNSSLGTSESRTLCRMSRKINNKNSKFKTGLQGVYKIN